MSSITARNHAALVSRNGTTVPEPKTRTRKAVAKGKDAVAPSNDSPKAPAPKVVAEGKDCFCGCGTKANPGKSYRPGHDARHAGQVGRLLVAKAPTAKAEFDRLAPALQEKALRFEANATAKEAKKQAAAALRVKIAAQLKAELAAL